MRALPLIAVLAITVAAASAVNGQDIVFRHVFDRSPLDVSPKPGQTLTPEVQAFHKSGQNPFSDKPEAIAQGKTLYADYCEACHKADGSGGMGANLIGDTHVYKQIATDTGLFEVIYGGAGGAMQPFSKRMSQDEILKVMAYLRTFMKP